ncbi:MAG: DNA repair protein RadC [Oscillospiraceae bacterium]|nr:DNA repair protein RadC [Oscillospiraceae bacterium]MBQ6610002.1 DNA repair protein RadC [Oscillospiraceae bacterium]
MSSREEELKKQRSGHRERVRRRFLDEGLDGFKDYEALEMLLFYAIPRQDTKVIAKRLIDQFGSLQAVFHTPPDRLMQEAGLTEATAALIAMLPQLARKIEEQQAQENARIRSTLDAGRDVIAMFRSRQDESVRILCLNASGKVVRRARIAEGDVNAVHFPIRKLVEEALACKAVSVILAHNHPGGTMAPSQEDLDATKAAKAALETVGIRLLDHLIVSGDNYCSLREEGYL